MRLKFIFFIIVFCFFSSAQLWSQKWTIVKNERDTVYFPSTQILVTKDTIIFSSTDTFAVLKRYTRYRLRKNPYSKSEVLYDSLRVKSYRKKITKELYNLFFKQAPIEVHDTSNFDKGEQTFKMYEGLIIKSIRLQQVDVIEGSIHDTLMKAQSWLGKSANNIHVNTSKRTIFNSLTFKTGDLVDAGLLSDNERIIRALPYIEDARIHVLPDKFDNSKVDILIITKDEFSIGAGADFNGFDNIRLNLFEGNFLGIGHSMQHSYIYHTSEKPKHGYGFSYEINNISKSFISAKIEYENSWNRGLKLIKFNKAFLTPRTKYAGGLSIYEIADSRTQSNEDTSLQINYRAVLHDIWAGRAFLLSEESRIRLNLSLRYAHTNFIRRPVATLDSNYFYRDGGLVLAEVSLVKRDFYKSSLVQGFGVTEDIPYGYTVDFQLGMDKNELTFRPYFGVGVSMAKHFKFPGYLKAGISVGNFYRTGKIEDGVVKFELSNIGNLHRLNKFSIRNYININFQYGINLTDPSQKTELNNSWTKIATGLNKEGLLGIQKLGANFESTLFTPWYLFGFKFAMFGYANVGWVSPNSNIVDNNSFLASFGAGFRLKNESWVFETLTIGFAVFAKAPEGSDRMGFVLDVSDPRLFDNFYSDKPRYVEMDQTPRLFID